MANWRCNDCGLDILEDDATTEAEPCPRCGKDMTRVDGVVLKNFGGSGFTTMEDKRG